MDKLKRFGQMYIKFGSKSKMEYGFRVSTKDRFYSRSIINVISNFVNFTNREIESVTLPELPDNQNIVYYDKCLGANYLYVDDFDGQKIKIIVPPNIGSVQIVSEKPLRAQIEFVLPKNKDLFEVTEKITDPDGGVIPTYHLYKFLVVADKSLQEKSIFDDEIKSVTQAGFKGAEFSKSFYETEIEAQ